MINMGGPLKTKALLRTAIKSISLHSLSLLFAVATLTMLAVCIYSRNTVNFFIKTSVENVKGRARESALRLTTMATAEELEAYRRPADMDLPGYRALRQKLIVFAEEAEVAYAFYLRVVDNNVRCIVDSDTNPKSMAIPDKLLAPLSDSPGVSSALEGRVGVTEPGENTGELKELCSAYAPVFGRDGKIVAICGVDVDDENIPTMRRKGQYVLFFELLCIAMVAFSGAYGFIKFRREVKSAQSANIAKSRFLSRMSHEIRTPMNAVLGMSELAIMDYGKPEGIKHIASIKRAGDHLLELINGILDFSALESGKLHVREDSYKVAPVFNDVLSMTRTRLKDKIGVGLFLDIAPDIPSALVGDETLVKELLLNLLSNAAKYTQHGFIRFAAHSQREGDRVLLTFEVSDSGIGIKPEDMGTLFADFSRVEDRYTTGIQGTGLGLSISRAICREMGGDVVAKSQYGVGSIFTATVRQGIADPAPMGGFVEDRAPFGEGAWTADFAAPDFRVLIVDDIATNLKVAEGFLAPYHIRTDTCLSGVEAIQLVQEKEYDLVLMDHLMPEMDGVEAAAAIRALGGSYEKLPIAVLTANAVAGMKDYFLNTEFDDYLSKPIETPKLRELLERWIPAWKRVAPFEARAMPEKIVGGDHLGEIEGLDTTKGMANAGGSLWSYMEVLEIFCRDANERIGLLTADCARGDTKRFITNVHALKSASASVGTVGVSEAAASLEAAGLRGDMGHIQESVDNFRADLADIVGRIEDVLEADAAQKTGEGDTERMDSAATLGLKMLKDALEREDVGLADHLLEELSAMRLGGEARDLLSRVSELSLMSEFQDAAKEIGDALG